jgi:hypothetical protein
MYAFHQRPLTWLFFIALACLNVLAISTNFQLDWYADLLAGQVMIAGGWLALGHAHRLARAGVFAAVVVAAASPDYLLRPTDSNMWRYVLGSLMTLGVVTAASSGCWLLISRCIDRQRREPSPRWRFSVAEILGWMIIVAVASLVVPAAYFYHLGQDHRNWQVLVAPATVAGLIMTLFLRPRRGSDVVNVAVSMIALTALAIFAAPIDRYIQNWDMLRALAAVGVWILVQRLDERQSLSGDRASPADDSLKIYDPELDDERRRLG